VLVSGRVQGVGFRAFARRAAQALGVSGHAINLPDGRVEVLACGDPPAVDALLERLREGPRWSAVEALEIEPADCGATGFLTG
jgi:acylphosphatase